MPRIALVSPSEHRSPNGTPAKAQRGSARGKVYVTCGAITRVAVTDHRAPLIAEYSPVPRDPVLASGEQELLNLDIIAGERIGQFSLGLAGDQFTAVCASTAGYRVPERGRLLQRGFYAYDFGLFVKARFDGQGLTQAVQVSGSGAFEGFGADFEGINLLATPASEVIALLMTLGTLGGDELGFRIVAPTLGLALARPTVPEDDDDEDGRYFTSVLTAYPGSMDVVA